MSADDLTTRALLVLVVLAVIGWLAWQVVGEVRLSIELRRPPRAPRKGWTTCLVRMDPPETGQPWREPQDEDQVESIGGEPR